MASIAAVVVQPLVFIVRNMLDHLSLMPSLHVSGFILVSVIVVAAAVVLILGIPTFLALRKFQRDGWVSLAFTGFVLGALPVIVFSWPRYLEGYSAGQNWHGRHVDTYINGVPTTYSWLIYGENAAYFGVHGLVGALVFYAVWRKIGHLKRCD